MKERFRRINILIGEAQYRKLQLEKINLSGLVRDLLEDRFNNRNITLAVGREMRNIYDKAISNFGATDQELEVHFMKALDNLLKSKVQEIEDLRSQLREKK